MNSISQSYNTNRLLIKGGNIISRSINLPLVPESISAPITVATVTVNTSNLCEPKIKLDFTLNIAIPEGISSTNIAFQVFRIYNNSFQRTPVGPQLSYVNRLSGGTTEIFTFFVYDYDICNCDLFESKTCTYTVDATLFA